MKFLKTTLPILFLIIIFNSCSKEKIASLQDSDIDLGIVSQTDWEMAYQIHSLINDYRITKGLKKLEIDKTYASAFAIEHSKYMITKSEINHDNFSKRSNGLKAKGAHVVGENVAFGYKTAESVVTAWINSPGHRKIIEGSFTHAGFGILKNDRGLFYMTHIFYRM